MPGIYWRICLFIFLLLVNLIREESQNTMANPANAWKVDYPLSSQSSCRTCKNNIDKEFLRLGKMVYSSHFDGFMPMWHHANDIFKKSNQIKLYVFIPVTISYG